MTAAQMKELLASNCTNWLREITHGDYALQYEVFNMHTLILRLKFWAEPKGDKDLYEFQYDSRDFQYRIRRGRYICDFEQNVWGTYSKGYNSFTELMVNECDVNFN